MPDPILFALHKLIVSARRSSAKSVKDTTQAAELIQALAVSRQDELSDAVRAVRKRGPNWRKAFDAGVTKLPEEARKLLNA